MRMVAKRTVGVDNIPKEARGPKDSRPLKKRKKKQRDEIDDIFGF